MDERRTVEDSRKRQAGEGPAAQAGGTAPEGPQYHTILIGLLAVLVVVAAFNQFQIATLYSMPLVKAGGVAAAQAAPSTQAQPSGASLQAVDVRPTGVPAIYGSELGIRYDDVSETNPQLADSTIDKLAIYDQQIDLQGADLQRYVKIGTSIACEYCCGAKTLVFATGAPACGCSHSYAMRGLAKYLIKNHGSEYTDDQILEELGKWKVLFFPGVHAQKAAVLKSQGVELNYVNLASNKYRGIESAASAGGSGGAMVGGC
ncbi:MAG: hypothetical protein AB1529_01070 [Candidatus Micrarchaeota archaeon]